MEPAVLWRKIRLVETGNGGGSVSGVGVQVKIGMTGKAKT